MDFSDQENSRENNCGENCCIKTGRTQMSIKSGDAKVAVPLGRFFRVHHSHHPLTLQISHVPWFCPEKEISMDFSFLCNDPSLEK